MSFSKVRTCAALRIVSAALALTPIVSAQAQTIVTFDGFVTPVCIIAVSTPGVLAMNSSATELGTEQPGGMAAILTVTSTGGAATIRFTAPSLSEKPAGYSGTSTVSLRYTSPGGANQPYTTAASQYTSTNPLGDTVTLNAKAVDPNGYVAGRYRLQPTATCQH